MTGAQSGGSLSSGANLKILSQASRRHPAPCSWGGPALGPMQSLADRFRLTVLRREHLEWRSATKLASARSIRACATLPRPSGCPPAAAVPFIPSRIDVRFALYAVETRQLISVRGQISVMSKSPKKQAPPEIEPDDSGAWKRFEKAVDTVVKAGPQHRTKKVPPSLDRHQSGPATGTSAARQRAKS